MTMQKKIKSKYMDELCEVIFKRFPAGELAIALVCPVTGEPWGKPTAACEPYGAPVVDHDKEVYMKDFNENEGMVKAFIEAGIIEGHPTAVPMGRTVVYRCTLTAEAQLEAQRQLKK